MFSSAKDSLMMRAATPWYFNFSDTNGGHAPDDIVIILFVACELVENTKVIVVIKIILTSIFIISHTLIYSVLKRIYSMG
jgi:hypothetical protein